MKRVQRIGVALVAAALVGLFAPGVAGTPAPQCLMWRTEALYRNYGYDHLVHIHNGCEQRAQCTVSTNVNPVEQHVSIQAGADATVVTFVGSPSSEFTARVECVLEP